MSESRNKTYRLSQQMVRKLLPARSAEGHKYTFGSVLVIGGSKRLPGAAALACESVLSAGAGAVTLAAPESVFESGLLLPEVMRLPLAESKEGTVEQASYLQLVKENVTKFDVFIIGPGMGNTPETQLFFNKLLPVILKLGKPLVIDADGLNCLSHKPMTLNNRIVLTPHIGEGRRLLASEQAMEALDMARDLRQKYKAVIVLKSAHTLIAGNDDKIWVNTTGNSGLATAGSGDVLAGVLAALMAQGCSPQEAALIGVYVHGLAGELASAEYTEYGVRAGLVSALLSPALKELT